MQPRESQVTSTVTSMVTSYAAPPVSLAVTEHGPADAAVHAVLLHGFPDDHALWDDVVAHLPSDWHVVTYDARGTGASSRPTDVAAYDGAHLLEDFLAVLDATVPAGARVHLVGHDWGSVAGWDLVAAETTDPRLRGRLASWTSISGPPLDHVATLASGWRGLLRMLPQLLHSWYALLFLVPGLPELQSRWMGLSRRVFARVDPTAHLLPWGPQLRENVVPAVNIYRAHRGRLARPRPWRTSVPVQLVVALRDGFITPRTLERLDARCRDLTRVELDCGHWVPRARPEQLARLLQRFVEERAAGRPAA